MPHFDSSDISPSWREVRPELSLAELRERRDLWAKYVARQVLHGVSLSEGLAYLRFEDLEVFGAFEEALERRENQG